MSLRFGSSASLTAAALVALVSATIRGDTEQTPEDLRPPRALDVTAKLAREGLTAGVVMCSHLRWTTDEEQPEDLVDPAEAPAQATCQELNASLFQRHEGGVLHVRTTGEPRRVTDLLNRSIHLEPASGVPAIEAVATRIVNAVRGDNSAGTHGSTGATGQLVTLRGGSTTVMQALDDVVRQAPGLVWYVCFSAKEDGDPLGIGLIGPHGLGSGRNLFPLPKGR